MANDTRLVPRMKNKNVRFLRLRRARDSASDIRGKKKSLDWRTDALFNLSIAASWRKFAATTARLVNVSSVPQDLAWSHKVPHVVRFLIHATSHTREIGYVHSPPSLSLTFFFSRDRHLILSSLQLFVRHKGKIRFLRLCSRRKVTRRSIRGSVSYTLAEYTSIVRQRTRVEKEAVVAPGLSNNSTHNIDKARRLCAAAVIPFFPSFFLDHSFSLLASTMAV